MATTNKLNQADIDLFSKMEGHYMSDNEREFFETLKYREKYLFSCAGDLYIFETDNEEQIYFVRYNFDEFELGHGTEGNYSPKLYVQCLADALSANLKQLGYINKDITFLQYTPLTDFAELFSCFIPSCTK